MLRINRIIGFLSVSFILVFVAKINKVELFSAYFKTIADVEIRNSQRVPEIMPEVVVVNLPSSLSQQPEWNPVYAEVAEKVKDCEAVGELFIPPSCRLSDPGLSRVKVWSQARPRAPGFMG